VRHDGVVVVGGGIAGLAAAAALVERGVPVTVVERQDTLGGRVRAWPVSLPDGTPAAMSRGFHAFFRQYYNLRALLRRADPALERLRPLADYPLQLANGPRDSFAKIPATPPWSVAAFVARSPSFTLGSLARVDVKAALGLLDVSFPATFSEYDGVSAAELLDGLRFPEQARHLALEVFARSFFAEPRDFSGGELVAMFHAYFVGSAEGLLFDVPDSDYDTALWAPLATYLRRRGARILTGSRVEEVEPSDRPGNSDGRYAGGPGPLRVTVAGPDGQSQLTADALVLAADRAALQGLVARAAWLGDDDWRHRVSALAAAPPFAVWRLWLDRPPRPGSPPFLGTSGYGPLDNVSFVDQFEEGAAAWARAQDGCLVELHAYALPPASGVVDATRGGGGSAAADVDGGPLRAELRRQLHRIHPELAAAQTRHEEWLVMEDCPLAGLDPWAGRPGVATPDARVVLAGDGIRCDYPVALMERAATTGWLAANTLLDRWGLPGHDLWTVPMTSRVPGVHALRSRMPRPVGPTPGQPP
jgi:isorenieratene synthase